MNAPDSETEHVRTLDRTKTAKEFLRAVTSTKAISAEKAVEYMQEKYYELGISMNKEDMWRLEGSSGIEVLPKTLQRIVEYSIQGGESSLPILRELMHRKKDFRPNRDIITTGFISYFDKVDLRAVNELESILGETAPSELVIGVCKEHLRAGRYDEFNKVYQARKAKMKIDNYLLQDFAVILLGSGRLEESQKFLEDHGIEPSDGYYVGLYEYTPKSGSLTRIETPGSDQE
jgi:hypothetical protein